MVWELYVKKSMGNNYAPCPIEKGWLLLTVWSMSAAIRYIELRVQDQKRSITITRTTWIKLRLHNILQGWSIVNRQKAWNLIAPYITLYLKKNHPEVETNRYVEHQTVKLTKKVHVNPAAKHIAKPYSLCTEIPKTSTRISARSVNRIC